MTNKPNTKRNGQQEAEVSQDLKAKIEAVRKALTGALVAGDPTAKIRDYMRELEAAAAAEQRKLDAAAAAKEASQRVAKEQEARAVAEHAQTLVDARDNRIAALASRYSIPARSIPDTRSSLHA